MFVTYNSHAVMAAEDHTVVLADKLVEMAIRLAAGNSRFYAAEAIREAHLIMRFNGLLQSRYFMIDENWPTRKIYALVTPLLDKAQRYRSEVRKVLALQLAMILIYLSIVHEDDIGEPRVDWDLIARVRSVIDDIYHIPDEFAYAYAPFSGAVVKDVSHEIPFEGSACDMLYKLADVRPGDFTATDFSALTSRKAVIDEVCKYPDLITKLVILCMVRHSGDYTFSIDEMDRMLENFQTN